jgi:hypothetical protein
MTVERCENKIFEEFIPESYDQENSPEQVNTDRRQVLKKLAAGTAALAGCSVMPERWTSPVLKFAALPAHAITSGDITAAAEAIAEATGDTGTQTAAAEAAAVDTAAADTAAAEAAAAAETAAAEAVAAETAAEEAAKAADELRGYSNSLTIKNTGDRMSCDSIWQDKFVFSKLGPQYAKSFLIVWSDGRELYVPDSTRMIMDVNQDDFRKYQPGGQYSGNNPDIPTMEVYAARGTHPDSVTMYY